MINLTRQTDITNLIDEIEHSTKNYFPGTAYALELNQFRVSSIGYCSRRIQFDKVNGDQEQSFDKKTLGKFTIGNILHEAIQRILQLESECFVSAEKRISYQYYDIALIGHYDLLITDRDGLKLVDIKTTNENSFYYRIQSDEPQYQHKIQANTYAGILGVNRVSILYVNTTNFQMCEKEFLFDQELFDMVLEKTHRIYEYTKIQKLIEKDYKESWECKYCPFRDICDTTPTIFDKEI